MIMQFNFTRCLAPLSTETNPFMMLKELQDEIEHLLSQFHR